MTTQARRGQPAAGLTPDIAEALAARLVGEMAQRWRQGDRPLAEEFLERCPDLLGQPQAAADLIYEEYCLRNELGPEIPAAEFFERFPQWRAQLEVMFDCERLLEPQRSKPQFPSPGEALGDFDLLTELGRGVQGPVFLARQRSLADRLMVLKLTPANATEHLSLARLQHTNIVPLYSMQDFPARNLRALCMPYFGGATLADILQLARAIPPHRRTARDLFDALRVREISAAASMQSPPQPAIRDESFAHAICRIALGVAEAMQYAHDRGLVHLDLKPSNVLVAADGQPMVLDFHLARRRIAANEPGPEWFGGTAGYMSPEQIAAFEAARRGRRVPAPVDERSDIYSLGIVLTVALGGGPGGEELLSTQPDGRSSRQRARTFRTADPLDRLNPQVSAGLADIVSRCLEENPADRYPTMASLAADLRRHLADLPLRGARNRSRVERWHKWRRRRPHGLAMLAMGLLIALSLAAVATGAIRYVGDRIDQADAALTQAQKELDRRDWSAAAGTLRRGLAAFDELPGHWNITDELNRRLVQAQLGVEAEERATAIRTLRTLADRVRGLYGSDLPPMPARQQLAENCRLFWNNRAAILARFGPEHQPDVRSDVLDVAIFWANLQPGNGGGRAEAVRILSEAEEQFGACPVLDEEMRLHGAVRPRRQTDGAIPDSAWRHYALARAYLKSGDLQGAEEQSRQALDLDPRGMWPNFYRGLCADRAGRYSEAAGAFSVCIGLASEPAACFYNRALAYRALGRSDLAVDDFSRALRIDSNLAAAAIDRGRLFLQTGRFADAAADFERARQIGPDSPLLGVLSATAHAAQFDFRAAICAVMQRPGFAEDLIR